ncbi:hypothetical protein [Herbaspirillum sp. VT-16-41]|uniref:hypothetical protein n=1 Tax=Herbaspirillum sp. VT-16-41 TaxID=1953765 RepID=UPI000982144E|nr:hypothetical protein [Herbaspirillum sp. VT-16-41]ONN64767.1 hypothetical protein BTM36_21935 [Herbaspirillum sp. VT-16-41]
MKLSFAPLFFLMILLTARLGYSEEVRKSDPRFTTSVYRQVGERDDSRHFYIERLLIQPSKKLRPAQVNKINSELEKLYVSLYSEARHCHEPLTPHPWGYDVKFDQINVTDDILSIVFESSEVCYGRVYFNKIAQNFSLQTGALLSAEQLLRKYAPSLLESGAETDKGYVKLGEDAGDILIEQNENLIAEGLEERCGFYLKTSDFHIWIKRNQLVLLPIFLQVKSACHNEYLLRFESAQGH